MTPPDGALGGGLSPKRFLKPGLFVLGLFVLLYFRTPGPEAPASAPVVSGPAFGTTYSVRFIGPDSAKAEVEAVVKSVVEAVNASMSTYHPDSELSRFNRLEGTASVTVSADLDRVMAEAYRVHQQTGGAFDPTVGPVVDAWGFGPKEVVEPPSSEALDAARAQVGLSHLARRAGQLEKLRGDVRVDLSAIAKGYAVAETSRRLFEAGVVNHLVEIGGELQARGYGPSGYWRVGIERPQTELVQSIYAVVPLKDQALATSGNYRNFRTVDGRDVTHIIDPRSGQPVSHGLGSVSVVHPDCTTADALATALYVMGEADGLAWAESNHVAALFLTPEGENVRRRASSAFEALPKPDAVP